MFELCIAVGTLAAFAGLGIGLQADAHGALENLVNEAGSVSQPTQSVLAFFGSPDARSAIAGRRSFGDHRETAALDPEQTFFIRLTAISRAAMTTLQTTIQSCSHSS